jgi:hypothetical protein
MGREISFNIRLSTPIAKRGAESGFCNRKGIGQARPKGKDGTTDRLLV